jgi:excinuclease ABC subunit C
MQKAADRLEYEEAAALRDLRGAIQNMQAASTVLTPEPRDVDAVALAVGFTRVWASILQVRDGKLVESLTLTLDNEMEAPLPEVLPAFLEQFYGQGVYLPAEVIVSNEMDLVKEVGGWVEGRAETNVSLHGPKEPWQEELIGLAEKNVLQSLREEVQQGETLEELKRLLGLKHPPRVMACFDISNLQGTFTVGSAVVFREGVPDKSLYRKFRIKGVEGIDDYASHREMMRRYLDLVERDGLPVPDLFLIDGGKGQLSTVEPILREHFKKESFGLASLAKREEEIFIPGHEFPVDFKGKLKARYLLQRIRDEAHRFAVGYHKILRDKNAIASLLETIPGIGPQRLRALYRSFDSVLKIKEATEMELSTIPGFNKVLAEKIYRHFHPQEPN